MPSSGVHSSSRKMKIAKAPALSMRKRKELKREALAG